MQYGVRKRRIAQKMRTIAALRNLAKPLRSNKVCSQFFLIAQSSLSTSASSAKADFGFKDVDKDEKENLVNLWSLYLNFAFALSANIFVRLGMYFQK